jgi:hypothetical protein
MIAAGGAGALRGSRSWVFLRPRWTDEVIPKNVLDIADGWWARDFGCAPNKLRPPVTHVQQHAGALTGNPGIWILVTGAAPLVSIPPVAMALLEARAGRWSAEVVANESAMLEELRPLAARHALSASLIPQYRTLLANEPSMRIAARLGFEAYGFSVYVRLAGS